MSVSSSKTANPTTGSQQIPALWYARMTPHFAPSHPRRLLSTLVSDVLHLHPLHCLTPSTRSCYSSDTTQHLSYQKLSLTSSLHEFDQDVRPKAFKRRVLRPDGENVTSFKERQIPNAVPAGRVITGSTTCLRLKPIRIGCTHRCL